MIARRYPGSRHERLDHTKHVDPTGCELDHGDTRGAGLGLAIVLAIVHRHGGTDDFSNRPAGGARVTLTIPDAVADQAA